VETNLFSDFLNVSSKAWKQKIQMDLKGADYNDTLLSTSNEGIVIKPFYHSDDVKFLEIPESTTQTEICQSIFIGDEKIANNIAKDALLKGANSIRFIAEKSFDYKQLYQNLEIDKCYLECHFLDISFFEDLKQFSQEINLYVDIIENFTETGHWFQSKEADFTSLQDSKLTSIVAVNTSLYQNAGANIVQQIAYALAHINEYLNTSLVSGTINVTFAIGSNYFFEISKLRAFRYLFQKLINEYDTKIDLKIHTEPTIRNKTIYDYNVNMLRSTTECMSAIIGGADVVMNKSYDAIFHKSNAFGERISRKQLLILQEESYFSEAKKVAKGTYFIEQLTYEIADKALNLFKDIEKQGGFLAQLKKGTIQRKIEESAQKEQTQFDNGELVLLGTNKFPNEADTMKNDMELYPFVKKKPRKTIIKPIIAKRLSEKLEQERLAKED
jgi:methylmalonyl-CoA mutase